MLTHDETRVVVTDYFLNQDGFGIVHFDGDHKVHVLKVEGDQLSLDPRFQLDFNTAFPGLRARPHGLDAK
jgi:selenium-binding protein 1